MSSSGAAAQLTASPDSNNSSSNTATSNTNPTRTTTTAYDNNLTIIQDMIELSANHLHGLRTQCSTSAALTQQEMRLIESKLIRYFSEMLLTKSRLNERIPANGLLPHHQATGNMLRCWLRVVGLSSESLNVCLARLTTLEQILQLSDEELKQLLAQNAACTQPEEELRRLTKALNNLRRCMDTMETSGSTATKEQWNWDSWDLPPHRGNIAGLNKSSPRAHHRQHLHQHSKSSPRSQQQRLAESSLTSTFTPSPPSSPFTPASGTASGSGTPQRTRSNASTVAGTPPPAKKHQTLLMHNSSALEMSGSEQQPPRPPRSRLPTDPSPDSHSSASNSDTFADTGSNSSSTMLLVPPSPGVAHVGMGHTIKHRFSKWIGFMATCKLCQKQMLSQGFRCTDCKYICHKACAPHVPPSCGLPPEYVHEFRQTQVGGRWEISHHSGSKASPVPKKSTLGKPACLQQQQLQHADSSSPSSSCTNSTPSSPALFQQQQQQLQATPTAACQPKPIGVVVAHQQQQQSQFNFPNVTITCNSSASTETSSNLLPNGNNNIHSNNSGSNSSVNVSSSSSSSNAKVQLLASLTGSQASTHSIVSQQSNMTSGSGSSSVTYTASLVNSGSFFPRKLSNVGVDKRIPFTSECTDTHKSNDSDKTVSLSGSASTDSDRTPVRLDSTEDGDSGQWRQNSISLKEWDIPYGDLHLQERIGQGRFGTVHRALWHGDVAVKLLNEDYLKDEQMLEVFRNEVANFKKTRHENLVLFMGACMNPPYLAIVTSLCKGNTLYTYIHQRREKFAMNRTLLIAQQIAQGMGYLHARDITHKDLRTKNIFIENGKVIITDFGLFSSTKLLYCDMGLGVPQNWLCYLAPELMRGLQPRKPRAECLEFTSHSDVYSFGTVWYELICGEFTFKDQPAESIIWQVGRGMKQSLANLHSGRDVKDLLMLCWTYEKEHRPDFARLLSLLEHLPKKRLARSPSHPVNLSRSAESVF